MNKNILVFIYNYQKKCIYLFCVKFPEKAIFLGRLLFKKRKTFFLLCFLSINPEHPSTFVPSVNLKKILKAKYKDLRLVLNLVL